MSVFVLQGIETLASLTLVETIEKKAPGNNQGRQKDRGIDVLVLLLLRHASVNQPMF